VAVVCLFVLSRTGSADGEGLDDDDAGHGAEHVGPDTGVAGEAVELGEPASHVGGLVLDDLDDVKGVRNRRHYDCTSGEKEKRRTGPKSVGNGVISGAPGGRNGDIGKKQIKN